MRARSARILSHLRRGHEEAASLPVFLSNTNRCIVPALFCQEHDRRKFSTFVDDPMGPPPVVPQRRVVVTGLGLVTPLGVGVARVWERLLAGKSGLSKLLPEDLSPEQRASYGRLQSKVVGRVPQEELREALEGIGGADPRRHARFTSLALVAAQEALQDADWDGLTDAGKRATGVVIGSGLSCTSEVAEAALLINRGTPNKLSPYFVPKILNNMAGGIISIQRGFQGPNHCAATACATGAHCIGDAARFVRNGDADVVLAGGAESCIDAIAIAGFDRMRALSTGFNEEPQAASRPFDAERDGFVLAEGAGLLVLEELQHALARGARIYAEVRGYGLSGDAHHMTQPDEGGRGARLAMRRALRQTGLPRSVVAHVNAHATSTPLGDAIEARAIADVFSREDENEREQVRRVEQAALLRDPLFGGSVFTAAVERQQSGGLPHSLPAVSSTKGATGHLLGAAGAVEAVFAVLALVDHVVPPTLNLKRADAENPLGLALVGPTPRALPTGPKAVLTNSFGFGGTNASLLFSTPPIVVDELVDGEL
eukprot:jgi/Botrbrau1/907/Bobra.0167s0024.2